ncbi:MAG: hypothetical protein KME19_07940 [Microcoleus vaginatus WJT46-NPBG5]|nr:hypothetical protein [Microcoleus vaginatus WJT46-NPBG5]
MQRRSAGFPSDADHLAQMMPRKLISIWRCRRWDSHINEGSSQGQLAGFLRPLG